MISMNIHDIQSVRLSDRGSERGGEGERGGDVEGHARRRGQCLGAVMWLRFVIVVEKFSYPKEQTTAITKFYNTTLIALKPQIITKWKAFFSISESFLFPHSKPKMSREAIMGATLVPLAPALHWIPTVCFKYQDKWVHFFLKKKSQNFRPDDWSQGRSIQWQALRIGQRNLTYAQEKTTAKMKIWPLLKANHFCGRSLIFLSLVIGWIIRLLLNLRN